MRKVLVAAIVFSLVLISGAFLSARAQSASGCNLSWLNPCNWHLSTCCPVVAPAAVEVPAPAPAPPPAAEQGRRYGLDIYSVLSRCQLGCPCNCPW